MGQIFHLQSSLTFIVWLISLILPWLLVFSSPRQLLEAESSNDHLALSCFKSLISDDPHGALTSWDDRSLHFCRWRGVTCSSNNNQGRQPRVVALDLQSLNLAGSLSPSIANLTALRHLSLSDNRLGGVIPEYNSLMHLRHVNLSSNLLTGTIPSSLFQNCSNLQNFSLSSNNIYGKIPANISRCSELQFLSLASNMLRGDIPRSLGSLSRLHSLFLNNNRLTGAIPPEIGNLSSLTRLHLNVNQLSGTIPASIGNLSSLVVLRLDQNNLTGTIPSSIGSLVSLAFLFLYANDLSGSIPTEIGDLANLTTLFLGGNQLVGRIPKSLGLLYNLHALILRGNMLEAKNAAEWSFLDALTNCTKLRVLILENNNLGGTLPKSIANLSSFLDTLRLGGNHITGSIPAEIGRLVNLARFNMSSNYLDGVIPTALGSLSKLVDVDLSRNHFAGEIPATLGNITGLTTLILASNQLNGSIPNSLGKCRLERLNLAANRLTGAVPKEILLISSLSILLDVSHNSLSGPLPPEIGHLNNLQTIDVSYNQLTGHIPPAIAQCQLLQNLYLQMNLFQGSIPSEFNQLKGIQVLDVSSNNLSGNVPDFLRSFHNMTYLNLSFNDLQGELPRDGIFSNVSVFSVVGNEGLCGGVPELGLAPCSMGKKHSSWILVVAISIAGGILCISFLIGFRTARHRRRRSASFKSNIKGPYRKVSFAELQKATDGFSPANLVGKGSFGSVYKGLSEWEDHKEVAVKIFDLERRGALRSFTSECQILSTVRHRNLVKILTACSSIDFQGNDFKALVFEFMPNGSLSQWLHPEANEQGGQRTLSLAQRLNISIDIASVLEYLHRHDPFPVLHCDLKPANVLLDDDVVAHISDFGLARFHNGNVRTRVETSTSSLILQGTIGYAAPEYGLANEASVQGDVYSYGILLLEMFTGKSPVDEAFNDGMNLHKYVEMALPEQVVGIIDNKLLFEWEEGETNHLDLSTTEFRMRAIESVSSVLRVGMQCSMESPKDRMEMEVVVRELHDIRDAFLRVSLS
ncbi:probable LRR receptor-like serine/threonine-protein kinase At3g47570 [Zingiber officinale]|uniref:Receptor kinase-like protein Xa21 n=1 Tax=Zingiber officinale TaxID=94328 RepID=A0A8J5I8H2_ZINOF|nr:probable LRR receptor-like serine/threonine-protein kinase At3g47570 [Zingiber officinale]KAG6537823.1 hypothetical protein ZIOFF_002922 [Zingiber officinale]